MMGFEIELDRRITDALGGALAGDVKLALFDRFRLVTDARHANEVDGTGKRVANGQTLKYSNVELVTTPPFEQLTTVSPHPADVLLKELFVIAQAFYKVVKPTPLQDVLNAAALPCRLTAVGRGAVVNPTMPIVENKVPYSFDDKGIDSLFVHYTVGYPAGRLGEALAWIAKNARDVPASSRRDAERALRAGTAAGELFAQWANRRAVKAEQPDQVALAGFIALVYTQLAAVVEHSYATGSKGQIKNKTVAMCRVPLREVAKVLPHPAQQFLWEQEWVDLLQDAEGGMRKIVNEGDLKALVAERATRAKEYVARKEPAASQAKKDLGVATGKMAFLPLGDDHDALAEKVKQCQDIIEDYTGAEAGLKEWSSIDLGAVAVLNVERQKDMFLWSIIDHALVPALEGRMLAAPSLTGISPDKLFKASAQADGGPNYELATDTPSDMGAEVVTIDKFLRSAFLTPGGRPIAPERLFGGLAEVPKPDVYMNAKGLSLHVVPLELRIHGPQRVTWNELGKAISEIINASGALMQ